MDIETINNLNIQHDPSLKRKRMATIFIADVSLALVIGNNCNYSTYILNEIYQILV